MPRPANKKDLLSLAADNYAKLMAFVDALPADARERGFELNGRDRNVRDVLIHLHEWHLLMRRWHDEGCAGGMPAVPAEGYTWRTISEMNREFWKRRQGTSLAETRRLLADSHALMLELIGGHSDAELFGLKVYPWTKTTTLGSYFVSATSSHYDWALKTLKPIKKML